MEMAAFAAASFVEAFLAYSLAGLKGSLAEP